MRHQGTQGRSQGPCQLFQDKPPWEPEKEAPCLSVLSIERGGVSILTSWFCHLLGGVGRVQGRRGVQERAGVGTADIEVLLTRVDSLLHRDQRIHINQDSERFYQPRGAPPPHAWL